MRLTNHACLPFYFAKETNLHLKPSAVSIENDTPAELQALILYYQPNR